MAKQRRATAPRPRSAKKGSRVPRPRKPPALGRPKIGGEEQLYLVFKENFHARQIFEFLRVNTLAELEQLPPAEILRRLTWPIEQTVLTIRRRLASLNRFLAGDEAFAHQYQQDAAR